MSDEKIIFYEGAVNGSINYDDIMALFLKKDEAEISSNNFMLNYGNNYFLSYKNKIFPDKDFIKTEEISSNCINIYKKANFFLKINQFIKDFNSDAVNPATNNKDFLSKKTIIDDKNNNILKEKKPVFNTTKIKKEKKNFQISDNENKVIRMYKNKISARNSRLRKKEYIKTLQEKIVLLEKQLEKSSMKCNFLKDFEDKQIEKLINKEKEAESQTDKNKQLVNFYEYKAIQNKILKDLFGKLIKQVTPIEIKRFLINLFQFNSNMSKSSNLIIDNILNDRIRVEDLYSLYNRNIPDNILYHFEKLKRYNEY